MPHWRQVPGYTKNTLFKDFRGRGVFSREEFVAFGQENYLLKEVTCQKKFRRGLREGWIVTVPGGFRYACPLSWRQIEDYTRRTLIEDFKDCLFFRREDFFRRGQKRYNLKKTTCRQKLWWAQRQGWVERRGDIYFFKGFAVDKATSPDC